MKASVLCAALVLGGCVEPTADVVLAPSAEPVEASGGAIQEALDAALRDERESEAMYEAVLAEYGESQLPFANIVRAERRHQQMLITQYERLGLPVPAEEPFEFELPESLTAASVMAAEAEMQNVALYDQILSEVEDDGVRDTFERLRAMSLNCHLPAFRRAAGQESAGGCGGGGCGGGAGMRAKAGQGPRGACGTACGGGCSGTS